MAMPLPRAQADLEIVVSILIEPSDLLQVGEALKRPHWPTDAGIGHVNFRELVQPGETVIVSQGYTGESIQHYQMPEMAQRW